MTQIIFSEEQKNYFHTINICAETLEDSRFKFLLYGWSTANVPEDELEKASNNAILLLSQRIDEIRRAYKSQKVIYQRIIFSTSFVESTIEIMRVAKNDFDKNLFLLEICFKFLKVLIQDNDFLRKDMSKYVNFFLSFKDLQVKFSTIICKIVQGINLEEKRKLTDILFDQIRESDENIRNQLAVLRFLSPPNSPIEIRNYILNKFMSHNFSRYLLFNDFENIKKLAYDSYSNSSKRKYAQNILLSHCEICNLLANIYVENEWAQKYCENLVSEDILWNLISNKGIPFILKRAYAHLLNSMYLSNKEYKGEIVTSFEFGQLIQDVFLDHAHQYCIYIQSLIAFPIHDNDQKNQITQIRENAWNELKDEQILYSSKRKIPQSKMSKYSTDKIIDTMIGSNVEIPFLDDKKHEEYWKYIFGTSTGEGDKEGFLKLIYNISTIEKNTKLGGILSEQLANLRIILSKMYSTVFKIYDENYANLSNVDYIYKFIEYLDKVIDYLPRSKNVLAGIDTQKSLTNKSKIESAEHVNDSESEDVKKLATENSFKKILAFIKTYAQENNKSIDEIFEMFDINHDQLIDRFEFKNSLFRICKESVNYEEIENAINYLDDGGDKKINFHEFAKGLYNEFNQDKIKLGVKKRDNNAMGKLKFKISREIRAQHIQTEFELFINMIIKCKEKYTKIQLEKNSIELSEYISLLDDNQVKEFVSIIYETLRKSSSQIQFSFFEFIGVMCSNIYLLSNNTYIKIEKIEILIIELFRKITEKINIIKNNCEFEPFQLFLKTGFKILKSKKETFASNKFLIFLENYISKLIQKANLEVNDSYQKQSQKMNEEQPSENDNMKTGIRDIKSLKDAQIFIKIIEKISRASDSKQIFKYIENVIILLAMSLKKIKRNDLLEDPIVGIYFEMQVTNWILNLLRCLPLNFEFNIEAWQIIFQILCSIMVSKLQLLSNEISDNDLLILLVKCSFIFKELKERPIIALLLFNKIPLNFINEVTTFLNKQFLTNINPNLTNFNYGVYCYYPETNEHKNHMNCAIDKCQLNYISSYGQYQILISFNLYIAFVSSLESPENSLMSSENEFIREILKMKKKKDFRRSLTLKTVHNISENFENQNENNSNCFISMLNKIFCCCSCCKRKNNQVTYADPEEGTSTARNFLIPIAPETNITITKNELTESKNQSAFRQESLNPEVSKFFKENLIEMFINSSEKINVQVPLLYSTIRDEKWKKGYASLNSDEAHPNGKNNLDFCEIKPIEDRLYSHINYYKSINKNMGSCIKCFKLNDLLKYFFYFILFAQIISFSITWNNDVRFLNCNQIHWIIQNIFCSFQIIILVWILISYFIINFRWIFSNVTNILKINQRKQSEIPPKTEEINNSNCLTIVNKIFRNSFIRICIISFFLSIGSFIYLPLSIFSIYFTLSFVEIIIFRSIHLEQFFKLFILIIQFYCIGSLYVIFLNGYIKNAQSLFLKDCTNLVECSVESIFGVLSLHSFISITNIESKDKIYAGIIILNGLLTVFVIYYSYKIFIEVIQILILLFGNKQSKRKMFETYYLNLKIEKLNKELSQDYIKRRKYLFFSLMKPKKECSRLDRDIRKKFKFITN